MVAETGIETDTFWMKRALDLAGKALDSGEFPVGCVLVSGESMVGSGVRIKTGAGERNELDHAEIMALRDWTGRSGGVWQQCGSEITAYCTLEPCLMCLGALLINRVRRVVYGYEDVMGGACGLDLSRPLSALGHRISRVGGQECSSIYTHGGLRIEGGVLRDESLALFQRFFRMGSGYWEGSLLHVYTMAQEVNT